MDWVDTLEHTSLRRGLVGGGRGGRSMGRGRHGQRGEADPLGSRFPKAKSGSSRKAGAAWEPSNIRSGDGWMDQTLFRAEAWARHRPRQLRVPVGEGDVGSFAGQGG